MEMVKRALIALVICSLLLFPASFICSAVAEPELFAEADAFMVTAVSGVTLNYPIYDSTTLTSSSPVILAPNGITFRINLAIVIRKGVIGVTKTAFDNGVSNGSITVLDDSSGVLAYPDPFVTPPIIDSANVNHVLAPYGASIVANNSTSFSFQIRSNGTWAANSSTFTNWTNNQYFTVLDEPVTEPPEEPTTEPPEEPTTPSEPEHEDYTPVVRYSIMMGFALYIIVSLIGFGIWKSVHLFNS